MAVDKTPSYELRSQNAAEPSQRSPAAGDPSRFPQIISHRGYKGRFPENTLCAVEGAIQAGTHALELDVHLSRDGEVVLSHDESLQRCFGIKKKITECDWAYLKTLRTVQAPNDPIPRLADVLEYLRHPGREHVWVLLDIKRTNDPATIMRRIAETIALVPVFTGTPEWHRRIVLGCWSARYLPPRDKFLSGYTMSLICFDFSYARQFMRVADISFNVYQKILMGPLGHGFLEEARAANHQVYLWTVNAPNLMRWGIRHRVDGVITDDPAYYQQICAQWEAEQLDEAGSSKNTKSDRLTLAERLDIWLLALLAVLIGWCFRLRYLPSLHRVQLEQNAGK
ncbi:hypothetical protein N7492_002306 [Penicillium capsulatum]|uniref:GP-PDE domain-containing protein n=1 Tax=Penicillium capsulatum TaxID=69766 RepID=A0A9W9LV31_9EURO|nr:hypothetical protein N7492_002306 [Penicillium capsulatum]KAJ6123088.1 hypothetical protein N7512_005553 [Penicillium capsulatum]